MAIKDLDAELTKLVKALDVEDKYIAAAFWHAASFPGDLNRLTANEFIKGVLNGAVIQKENDHERQTGSEN